MKAREYLRQLKVLNARIDNRISQLDELKQLALATGGTDYSQDRVQSSRSQDSTADKIAAYVDLETEINADIDRYIDMKHRIIEQINALDNDLYIKILALHYAENYEITDIAVKIHYSYEYVRHKHIQALEAFEDTWENELEAWKEESTK